MCKFFFFNKRTERQQINIFNLTKIIKSEFQNAKFKEKIN